MELEQMGQDGMDGSYPLDCYVQQSTCGAKNITKIILSSTLLVLSRPRRSISLHYCDRSSQCSALWQFGRRIGKYQCFQPVLTQTSFDNNLIYLFFFIFFSHGLGKINACNPPYLLPTLLTIFLTVFIIILGRWIGKYQCLHLSSYIKVSSLFAVFNIIVIILLAIWIRKYSFLFLDYPHYHQSIYSQRQE